MLIDILKQGAEELGLELDRKALEDFSTYFRRLEEKNKVMNLTAISGERDVATLHFLDCLALTGFCAFKGAKLIDLGSGAGFPGLPLLIAEPTINLTLLDAQRKRVDFLRELTEEMGYDAACIHARAEEAANTPEMRERFDFAVSRAVARLNLLCELCLPFVKKGGAFIAMKGVDSDAEIKEAEKAIKTLGGKLENVRDYKVPCTDIIHRAVIIRKKGATPEKYPRAFAKIQKTPL